jgi:hypothetical protein
MLAQHRSFAPDLFASGGSLLNLQNTTVLRATRLKLEKSVFHPLIARSLFANNRGRATYKGLWE